MTISKGIKEKISALSDGELSEFETRRVLEEIQNNPQLRDYWKKLQISKFIKVSLSPKNIWILLKKIQSYRSL